MRSTRVPPRHQVDLHLPGDHPPLRLGVQADVTCDGSADEPGVDEFPDAPPGHRVVVRDHRELAFALEHEFLSRSHAPANCKVGGFGAQPRPSPDAIHLSFDQAPGLELDPHVIFALIVNRLITHARSYDLSREHIRDLLENELRSLDLDKHRDI